MFVWVLWHIKLCRLFDVDSVFIQINSSISSYSVQHNYTVYLSRTFLFQVIQFSQTVLIQIIQFSERTFSMLKTVLFQTIQFSVSTVSMSKTILLKKISLAWKNISISNNSVQHKYII